MGSVSPHRDVQKGSQAFAKDVVHPGSGNGKSRWEIVGEAKVRFENEVWVCYGVLSDAE